LSQSGRKINRRVKKIALKFDILHIKMLRVCGTCGEEEYGTRGFGGSTPTNEST